MLRVASRVSAICVQSAFSRLYYKLALKNPIVFATVSLTVCLSLRAMSLCGSARKAPLAGYGVGRHGWSGGLQ